MSVERAAELMARARAGVALTGAGISAESGIPTFRGAGGLWAQYDPVKVASIDNFLRLGQTRATMRSPRWRERAD